MSARIALVGDPVPFDPGNGRTASAVTALGPDVETRRFATVGLLPSDLQGADGIWLEPRSPHADEDAVDAVVRLAAATAIPLLPPPAGPEPAHPPHVVQAFVDAARQRAAWRESQETALAREAAFAAAAAAPRPYVHQMRGPRYRWWRPVLALVLMLLSAIALFAAGGVPLVLLGVLPGEEELMSTPWGAVVGNLGITVLGLATLIGLGLGFWRSPWRVFSVAGRMRWRWLARSTVTVLPVWVAYLVVSGLVLGQGVLPRSADWLGLVVVSLVTTPLQAGAEEVAFRGGIVQTVGAWIPGPRVALVVTTVTSTALFALAHGSLDPWVLGDLSALAVGGCYLAWRTGGLEAVIAVHVVNNVLVTVSGAVLGGLTDSYIDTETTGSPVGTLLSWLSMGLVTALLLWQARRSGVAPRGWLTPAVG